MLDEPRRSKCRMTSDNSFSTAPRGTPSSSRSSWASSWMSAYSSAAAARGLADPAPGYTVPDTVHSVLAARIDRLPALEKAASRPRPSWGGCSERAGGPPAGGRRGARLRALEERDFVRRRGGSSIAGQREYAIKHALTREVAYASIPKARRGRLHAAALGDCSPRPSARPTSTRRSWRTTTRKPFTRGRRPRLGDDPDEPRVFAGRRRPGWRGARPRTVRDGRGDRASHPCCGAGRQPGGALGAVARDRAVQRAPVRRRGLLGGHAAVARALYRPRDVRRDTASPRSRPRSAPACGGAPRAGQIEEWVERALELAGDADAVRVQALLARALVSPGGATESVLDEIGVLADARSAILISVRSRSPRAATRPSRGFASTRPQGGADRRLELCPSLTPKTASARSTRTAFPPPRPSGASRTTPSRRRALAGRTAVVAAPPRARHLAPARALRGAWRVGHRRRRDRTGWPPRSPRTWPHRASATHATFSSARSRTSARETTAVPGSSSGRRRRSSGRDTIKCRSLRGCGSRSCEVIRALSAGSSLPAAHVRLGPRGLCGKARRARRAQRPRAHRV